MTFIFLAYSNFILINQILHQPSYQGNLNVIIPFCITKKWFFDATSFIPYNSQIHTKYLSTAISNECNKDLMVCKNFVDPQMHHVFSASRNKI